MPGLNSLHLTGPPPLIFQDVDGVLNHDSIAGPIDYELVKNLGKLARETNANFVVSSQWRKYPEALEELRDKILRDGAGIPPENVVGVTPSLCFASECRAAEIAQWLAHHPKAAAAPWIAIDDRDIASQDPGLMNGHFVRVDGQKGFTQDKVAEAAQLLKAQTRRGTQKEGILALQSFGSFGCLFCPTHLQHLALWRASTANTKRRMQSKANYYRWSAML